METESEVQKFFDGTTVFLTGGSGFLGKVVLEKLLRTCTGIKKIYLLLRSKRNKDVEERLRIMFELPLFERLKIEQPDFKNKVEILTGDISEVGLGLSDVGKQKILDEVDCVLNVAAIVRFDESLRSAAYCNVRSVMCIIEMAKNMKQLKSIVHVSTAYVNCSIRDIEEVFYDPPISGKKLMSLLDCLDDECLNYVTPKLLGVWPNTYVFTKLVAEDVIRSEGKGLPITIVRPSLILSTAKEPIAGWVDNLSGITGVVVGSALGILRTFNGSEDGYSDIVPCDYISNSIICAAWEVGVRFEKENTKNPNNFQVIIHNNASVLENRITNGQFNYLAHKEGVKVKTARQLWHNCFKLRPNKFNHKMAIIFQHYLPAYIVDFVARCLGKKPMLVKMYDKIHSVTEPSSYFIMNQWKFKTDNTQALYQKLSSKDKELFGFDMKQLKWEEYFYPYVVGCRVYLIKDPLETIPTGEKKYRILQICHYGLLSLLLLLFYLFCTFLWRTVF